MDKYNWVGKPAIVFTLLPAFITWDLLPTWMFINSLSLITHTPLMNTDMPANAHNFLNRYLDLVRLNWDDLNLKTEEAVG